MGAPHKADWREERRKRAWNLKQQGWLQKDIAVALGVSEGAVSQWLKRAREGGGVEALASHPGPGGVARLSAEQRAQIPGLLARGAVAYGFRGDVWTAKRVAEVIWQTFGVRYSRDHVSWLLRRLGWSRQRPSRALPSATTTHWRSGRRNAGQHSKKGGRTALHHCLGRRIGVLPVAAGSAHVGAGWANASAACAAHP